MTKAKRKAAPKKVAPKKKVKTQKDRYISDSEAEAMFVYWCEVQDLKKVAAAFGWHRNSIYALARKANWRERYEKKVKPKIEAKTETAAADTPGEMLKMARAMSRAAMKGLFKKGPDGRPILAVQPTIRDTIAAISFENDLRERLGMDEVEERTKLSRAVIDKAVEVCESLGAKGLKALGDYIVRKMDAEDPERMIESGFPG